MSTTRILVVGNSGVGKTSICTRFTGGIFSDEHAQTIEDCYSQRISVGDKHLVLEIIDTGYSEANFQSLKDLYYSNATAFVLVYDVCDPSSLDLLSRMREDILDIKDPYVPPMILVGNKSDLDDRRQVSSSSGEMLAKSWKCPYLETSAKENTNIETLFYLLATKIIEDRPKDRCTMM